MSAHSTHTPIPFAIRHHRVAADACAVSISGELDLVTAAELRRTLHMLVEQGFTRVILDLSDVTLIDSTTLSVLVALHQQLSVDGSLSVAAASPPFARLLEMTGLTGMFGAFTVVGTDLPSPVRRARSRSTGTSDRASCLTPEAAVLAAIADTAIPFALTRDEQAARWVRILRSDSDTGIALAALAGSLDPRPAGGSGASAALESPETVIEHATRLAFVRGALTVDPRDLLAAVLQIYRAELQPTLDPDPAAYDAFVDEFQNPLNRASRPPT
jgi:anti-sigma B factor antagonist